MISKDPFRACHTVPVQAELEAYVASALSKDTGRMLLRTVPVCPPPLPLSPPLSSGNSLGCKNRLK